MSQNKWEHKNILVYADWEGLKAPRFMGVLSSAVSRGKEVFLFSYDADWLKSQKGAFLDPNLRLFSGPQYPQPDHQNFGLFLDSAPDRWGRVLMRRREDQLARDENRPCRTLQESDYLLGVYDGHRMGGLRFKLSFDGPFLDDQTDLAVPPWTQLRSLEQASLELEKEGAEKKKEYAKWLRLLIAPGGSLGGARPKASVIDHEGNLWIAKFPSRNDDLNVGAWEYLVHQLATLSKINTAEARMKRFSGQHDTFLTKRFDRCGEKRIHFASAMTLLGRKEGDGVEEGVSYLDLVDFLIQNGSQVQLDLEQLWRRIVFNMCVSNTDDHLRNHGFILTEKGWKLSPAYDMNPSETGEGLRLGVFQNNNAQNLDLALDVAEYFRLKKAEAKKIMTEIVKAVSQWKSLAKRKFSAGEIARMRHAFRLVEG